MQSDMRTLIALCEKADNDIRSCLNTLQFLKGRCKTLTLNQVSSMSLGQKDAHKSLFSVWQSIFQMPKQQRKQYVNPYDRASSVSEAQDLALVMAQNNTTSQARFTNIYQTAIAAGDTNKIMQGLFENYLNAKVKDPRMDCVRGALEWLEYVDLLNERTAKTQNYVFMRYSNYLPVMFHLLFASNHPERIRFPNTEYEFRTKMTRNDSLIVSMLNDVKPGIRKHLNRTLTVTEMLHPLLDIIQPTLRPVNTQLYSKQEKEDLKHLIHVMIAYNLTYHQQRGEDGQYVYVLAPELEDVVRFSGQKSHRQMTYAAKQLISREIELERMRRSDPSGPDLVSPPNTPKTPKQIKNTSKPGEMPSPATPTSSLPSHLRTLTPVAITPRSKRRVDPCRDFFGREISRSEKKRQEVKTDSKIELIDGDIWFRFKEGYTNAVSKTVRIQDLM